MTRARLLTGLAAVLIPALVTACGSSGHPAAAGTHSPAAPASSPAASPTASTVSPTPSASPTPAGEASPTASATTPACAALAAHTFLHITTVASGPDGSLALTGNPATLICGGPDDYHYDIATMTETGHVNPGAAIEVFPVTATQPEAIGPYQLSAYLATDQDTRVFEVTGPLSRITGLQEEFHP